MYRDHSGKIDRKLDSGKTPKKEKHDKRVRSMLFQFTP